MGFIPEISIPGFIRLLKAAYPEALPDFIRAVEDLPGVKAKTATVRTYEHGGRVTHARQNGNIG